MEQMLNIWTLLLKLTSLKRCRSRMHDDTQARAWPLPAGNSEIGAAVRSRKDCMGMHDSFRLDARRRAEGEERRLVAHEKIDEAGEEAGIADSVANLRGCNAGEREETR